MQFSRQGAEVFIKLEGELRKIHIFILQYLFIQRLLMIKRRFICIQVQVGCIRYMRVTITIFNCLKISDGITYLPIYYDVI